MNPEWWIENYWIKYSPEELAKMFNVDIRKIICRVYYLKKRGYIFHPEPVMINHCDNCKKQISAWGKKWRVRNLCRSCSAKELINKRGGKINHPTNKMWTKQEEELFITLYPTTSDNELMKMFSINKSSMYHKSHRLNLHKNPEFYAKTINKILLERNYNNNPNYNPQAKEKKRKTLKEKFRNNPELLLNARLRRNQMTNIEKIMEEILKKLNINYKWNKYVRTKNTWRFPDFTIDGKNLVIECDGEYWHSKNKDKDEKRQKELEDIGLEVIRFSDKEILKNTKEVEECLRQKLNL